MCGLAGRGIVVPCFPQIKMFQDLLYDFRLLIKAFFGTSENAVKSQIWIAVYA
jgi:hypothetical protein